MIVTFKKGFYFSFLVSEKKELDTMCRDLALITKHTEYEKEECVQFIKK